MKKYLSSLMLLAMGALLFTACGDDDNDGPGPVPHYESMADGVFVINEGSYFSKIDGTLDFLNYKSGTVSHNVFSTANGRSLGGTPNSGVVCGQNIYIVASDENRVEIVNTSTFKAETPVSVQSPREACTDGESVYVSSWTGQVTRIDASTHEVARTSEVIGSHLEGIAVSGGYVYVCNSADASKAYTDPNYYLTTVVKLDAKTLAKVSEISVTLNPTQILASGRDLYVLSSGNYGAVKACVQKIEPDNSDKVTEIAEATMMAIGNGKIYLVNAPYGSPATYQVYDLKEKDTNTFIAGTEIFSPYAINVDPTTGEVFITSLSKDPDTGYASYTTDGRLYRYKADGTSVADYTIGVNPGTLVFNVHQQLGK
ncbi:hypothetical protein SAMN06298210_10971 [Prevotellaceae bacterium KH2P17]|nr:hypothetical protein SAMN06298210_10971 [Prevotellaceae bacterium KH2P17]